MRVSRVSFIVSLGERYQILLVYPAVVFGGPTLPTHEDCVFLAFHDGVDAKQVVVGGRDFLEILFVEGAFYGRVVPFGDFVGHHVAIESHFGHDKHLFRPPRQIPFFKRTVFFIQTDSVSHFKRSLLLLLLHVAIQPLPHLPRIVVVHLSRCNTDTPMEGGIVTADQGLKRGEILGRVVGGHVTVESLFERAIKSFHHAGFGVSRRGKMMHAVLFQYFGDVFVVKFLPVVRLEFLRRSLAGFEQSCEGRGHLESRLLLDG